MSRKKFFLLMSFLCGIIALFMIGKAWQINERGSSLQEEEEENNTTITEDIVAEEQENTRMGAIAKVKGLSSQSDQALKEEASQFGLNLWPSNIDDYKYIKDRLYANKKLSSALRSASEQGVSVNLERKFFIGTNYVNINVESTDQEIIEFLLGK